MGDASPLGQAFSVATPPPPILYPAPGPAPHLPPPPQPAAEQPQPQPNSFPAAWVHALVRGYLDGKARLALAATCKGAWQMVLQHSSSLTITLVIAEEPDAYKLLTSQYAALTALQQRSAAAQHNTLVVDCWDTDGCYPLVYTQTAGILRPVGQYVHTLHVRACQLPSAALQALSRAMPAVSSLLIGDEDHPGRVAWDMPSDPSCFPALRSLHLLGDQYEGSGGCADSVVPYLSQLTRLRALVGCLEGVYYPTHLFSGPVDHTSPWAIAVLQLPSAGLDDTLLSLLVGCAPLLEELEVGGVLCEDRTHAATQWSLKKLETEEYASLTRLACLPQPVTGTRTTLVSESLSIKLEEDAELLPRLACFDVSLEYGVIIRTSLVDPEDTWHMHLALRGHLQHLAHLAGGSSITFDNFKVTSAFAEVMSQVFAQRWRKVSVECLRWAPGVVLPQPFPALDSLSLANEEPVPVSGLLRYTSAVKSLSLYAMDPEEGACAAQPWPWEKVHLWQSMTLRDIALLPDPAQRAQPPQVHFRLSVNVGAIQGLESAGRRLAHMRILEGSCITITPNPELEQAELLAALRTTLQVLSSCVTEFTGTLALKGWVMSRGVMRELWGALPRWTGKLALLGTTWLPDEQYSALSGLIPSSYRQWDLGTDCPRRVVEQVCYSAPSTRTQENPLEIYSHRSDKDLIAGIKQYWKDLGAYDHVALGDR